MRNPQFTPLDLRDWKRGQMFYYFAKMAPTGYSLTVDVDITRMLAACREAGGKFFPAYLWLVTRCLNLQTEFRIAEREGQIGYYDFLTPLYASFHEDDKTFSLMWTEFREEFGEFYRGHIWRIRNAMGTITGSCVRIRRCPRRTPIRYPAYPGFPSGASPSTPMGISPTIFHPWRRGAIMKAGEKP